jgi:hypothetical protein
MPGSTRAVGQGLQPARPITAPPAMDPLAADPVALGDLDHREPVGQDFHDGVEVVLCHCELQEHAPTSSPRPEWAKQKKDGRSCQPSTGTLEPISRHQHDNHQPGPRTRPCRGLARDLPETALHVTSRRPTTQPSAAPFTCSVAWVDEVVHGDVNHPHINGMQAVRGSSLLSRGGSVAR